jgi:TusA-related sulfurtransferase
MRSPGPLMILIGTFPAGFVEEVVEVLASDEGIRTSIATWVAGAGHELIDVMDDESVVHFVVRKLR